MNAKQNNFDFLVEYVTTKVVEFLIRDLNLSLEKAMLMFHNSETFEKLDRQSTGLYIESPAFVYEVLRYEMSHGTLRGFNE